MIVVHVPVFATELPKPEAKPERMATITIRRGDEWQTAPVVMRAAVAIELADECQKRGLSARVVSHG